MNSARGIVPAAIRRSPAGCAHQIRPVNLMVWVQAQGRLEVSLHGSFSPPRRSTLLGHAGASQSNFLSRLRRSDRRHVRIERTHCEGWSLRRLTPSHGREAERSVDGRSREACKGHPVAATRTNGLSRSPLLRVPRGRSIHCQRKDGAQAVMVCALGVLNG